MSILAYFFLKQGYTVRNHHKLKIILKTLVLQSLILQNVCNQNSNHAKDQSLQRSLAEIMCLKFLKSLC